MLTQPGPATVYEAAYRYLCHNGFKPHDRLKKVDVVVVDEVFLIPAVLFTLSDVILRGARDCYSNHFGGTAMFILGDPLQGSAIPDENCTLSRRFEVLIYLPRH